MAIWHNKTNTVHDLQRWATGTMSEHLGIEILEIGENFIRAKMPVDQRTRQPYGILHGGASAALSETVGSIASALATDRQKFQTVGIELNINHIKSVKEGFVYATCKPLHIGRLTHVWDIRISNEEGQLTAVSRLTVAVIEKRL